MPGALFAQEAEDGLTLSVTPTLFEMSASPTQTWNSSIKVINNNRQPLTVYAHVVNFAPQGETGEGKFLPVFEGSNDGSTLAEWINITGDPIDIEPEQSMAVPFTVQVPQDATPGGHFAAILIGTRPPETDEKIQVITSQIVTSLFFVRIAGDVVEEGNIRAFRTTESFVDVPRANFEVRFENKGNVHLQPQGEIVITNMWGKERGVIPINRQTHFGNVLPNSIRKFEFSWNGEPSFSDIGRYKAALTLSYGDEGKKFVSGELYFYVIPLKTLAIVLGSLFAFIVFVTWAIKAYIRKMLLLAGVEPELSYQSQQRRGFVREGDVRIVKRASIKAPVQSGVHDLQTRLASASALIDRIRALVGFVSAYRIFFGSVVVVIIALTAAFIFLKDVTTEQRDYEVVIDKSGTNVKLSSEEIMYDRTAQNGDIATSSAQIEPQEEQKFSLTLVNSSDTPGAAAALQKQLETEGYQINDLQSDFSESKERTVIVYDLSVQDEALALSKKLSNALLSASTQTDANAAVITVYIGNDLTF